MIPVIFAFITLLHVTACDLLLLARAFQCGIWSVVGLQLLLNSICQKRDTSDDLEPD